MFDKISQAVTRVLDNRRVLMVLLTVTALLYSLGLFLPMMTLSKFVVIKNSFSIMSGLAELASSGKILIFLIVGVFSVALPVMKIRLLFLLLKSNNSTSKQRKRLLHLMHEYGRWAMLDVMVVAVLIVTVKLGAIASIKVEYGLYLFGAAVVLLMLITSRVSRLKNTANSRKKRRVSV